MISGSKLLSYRLEKGLTQQDLSTSSGVSLRTVQRIENGESTGSPYTLKALSKALNLELSNLYESAQNAEGPSEDIWTHWRIINYACFFVIFIPFANILLPTIYHKIFLKGGHQDMVRFFNSFEILWTAVTVISMVLVTSILSLMFPFLLGGGVPIWIFVFLMASVVHLIMTMIFAARIRLQQHPWQSMPLV